MKKNIIIEMKAQAVRQKIAENKTKYSDLLKYYNTIDAIIREEWLDVKELEQIIQFLYNNGHIDLEPYSTTDFFVESKILVGVE